MVSSRRQRRPERRVSALLVLCLLASLLSSPVWCRQAQGTDEADPEPAEEPTEPPGKESLGLVGGPRSVEGRLIRTYRIEDPWYRLSALDRRLEPWFDRKERIARQHGLAFSLSYTPLVQAVNESRGEDRAASGTFQFLGAWRLIRKGPNTGGLSFQLEHRHRLGTRITPAALGPAAGSIVSTALDFDDLGLGLTRLYWRQKLNRGRVVLLAGRVDPGDYFDTYPLNDPLAMFLNEALAASPTVAAPEPGLGVAIGFLPSRRFYLAAGLSDANGSLTRAGLDTFFEEREYFKAFELGWVASWKRRFKDNAHLTVWQVDKREIAGAPGGWGLNLSVARTLRERWIPFFRAGWSSGEAANLEATVAGGLAVRFRSGNHLGFGVSRGRPWEHDLPDQTTSELYFNLVLAQTLTLSPDLQYIKNPALAPDQDSLVLVGLRISLTL